MRFVNAKCAPLSTRKSVQPLQPDALIIPVLGHAVLFWPPPTRSTTTDRAGLDLSLLTVFGLFVCLALTWRYRLSHNQPPSYDTRQPNNKRRTVNIQRSRLLSPTGFIVIITYYFVAFVAFLISLKSFLILYYSPSVLHQQFHGMSCLPDMPIQIFACLYCRKSQLYTVQFPAPLF